MSDPGYRHVRLEKSERWSAYRVYLGDRHVGSVENNGLGSWRGWLHDGRSTHPFRTRKQALEQLLYIQGGK